MGRFTKLAHDSISKKKVRQVAGGMAYALGLGLLLWLGWIGFHVYDLVGLANEIRGMKQIHADYDWVGASDRLLNDLDAIQSGTQPLFLIARVIPEQNQIGYLARQAELFLGFSTDLAHCAKILAKPGISLLATANKTDNLQGIDGMIDAIGQNMGAWKAAETWYQAASVKHLLLDAAILPDVFRKPYRKVDENFELLGLGIKVLQELPELAGVSQPKTYLLVAQNNDELRATGGFISGIGTIKVANGKIETFTLGDSYLVDDFSKPYPAPPMPIQRFMLAGYWVPRDANWSPDFPTSARKLTELLALSTGQQTDGVIAFDQTAVQELLSILGPVTLSGIDSPITSDNVEQYMHDAWASGEITGDNQDWWLHRKDFMKELGSELIKGVMNLNSMEQYLQCAGLVKSLIHTGHFMIYVNMESVQSALVASGLAGDLRFERNPAFLLVDSNMGFNKMDAVIHRSIEYQMNWTDLQAPVVNIRIVYQNPVKEAVPCNHIASYGDGTYQDMEKRCYWNYWRFFLPDKSQILEFSAPPIPNEWLLGRDSVVNPVEVGESEGGATVIGGMVVIPPGKTQEIQMKVLLPALEPAQLTDGNQNFRITFYKQPGLESLPITVDIQLPGWIKPCSGQYTLLQKSGGHVFWSGPITEPMDIDFCSSGN